jgi:hypothetical protein
LAPHPFDAEGGEQNGRASGAADRRAIIIFAADFEPIRINRGKQSRSRSYENDWDSVLIAQGYVPNLERNRCGDEPGAAAPVPAAAAGRRGWVLPCFNFMLSA